MQHPPTIFAFIDFRAWIEAWLTHRRSVEPGYTYAVFADAAGLSRSALPNVLGGARSPRPETLDAFATAMGLGPAERNYLGLLVELDTAPSVARRREVLAAVMEHGRFGQSAAMEDRPDAFERFTSRWYYGAILELARHPAFRPDPDWIAATLTPTVTAAEAGEAVDTLLGLELLRRDPSGDVRPTHRRWTTEETTTLRASHRFHREIVPVIAQQFDAEDSAARHLLGGVLTLSADALPEAKVLLNQVTARLGNLSDEASGEGRRVYHYAVQLVPLTRTLD